MIRKITGWLIISTFAVWIIWDLIAYSNGENSTISVVITDFAYYTPAWPLIVGILIGHFFFPAKGSED